ncbi:hypothetical protein IFO70_10270 [Phormidium tenue FACHB-886]|nr:hypothetical protein [Phormidium tenue FACHB-886]
MYSLEQLYGMAQAGLIDWSVYYNALNSQQQLQADRSFQVQSAIDDYQAQQQFNNWAVSQDAMYGTNVQQQAAQLRQQCQQASQQGSKSIINKYFGG